MLEQERPLDNVHSCKLVEEESILRLERLWLKLRNRSWRALAFSRYIEKENVDLIHCHFAWCLWECFERFDQASVLKRPMLVSVHGTDISKKMCHGNHLAKFELMASKPNLFFAATTPFLMHSLLALGVKKEKIFIGILESISAQDAKIIIAAKDKKLDEMYGNITYDLVEKAFPALVK